MIMPGSQGHWHWQPSSPGLQVASAAVAATGSDECALAADSERRNPCFLYKELAVPVRLLRCGPCGLPLVVSSLSLQVARVMILTRSGPAGTSWPHCSTGIIMMMTPAIVFKLASGHRDVRTGRGVHPQAVGGPGRRAQVPESTTSSSCAVLFKLAMVALCAVIESPIITSALPTPTTTPTPCVTPTVRTGCVPKEAMQAGLPCEMPPTAAQMVPVATNPREVMWEPASLYGYGSDYDFVSAMEFCDNPVSRVHFFFVSLTS